MEITATTDSTAMRASLDAIAAAYPTATARALNRTINNVKTVMVRAGAQDLSLKVSDVRNRVLVSEATPDHLAARLTASRKRLSLIDLGAKGAVPSRGVGRGVTYRLRGVTVRISNAFIATLASGHVGVFTRNLPSERKSEGAWSKNLPIKERFGPSIQRVLKKFVDVGNARALEQFGKNLKIELNFLRRSRSGS